MSCQDEVIKIGKKLEKLISSKSTDDSIGLDLLKSLQKLPMTLDVLTKTRIGMTVNNFRKTCKKDEVVTLAKSLIKSWKRLLPEGTSGSQSKSTLTRSSSSVSSSKDEDSRDSQQNDNTSQKSDSSHGSDSPRPSNLVTKVAGTTDTVRLKCRELLASAFKCGGPVEGAADFALLGAAIEDCIFQEFKNTEMKYKNRIRSRIANIKDPKNPRLREDVLLGYISPERMAAMTAEEMASQELKELRAKLTKEAIDDHQMGTQAGTKSDLFKCSKCGERNTTYNQVQTRSADEPMTTFVLCNHCGNRWKFC